jgi:hypothetical protein
VEGIKGWVAARERVKPQRRVVYELGCYLCVGEGEREREINDQLAPPQYLRLCYRFGHMPTAWQGGLGTGLGAPSFVSSWPCFVSLPSLDLLFSFSYTLMIRS